MGWDGMADDPERGEKWEHLDRCPVCGAEASTTIYASLTDGVFGYPETSRLVQCDACGSGYLNPRLTPERIGEAYTQYYTHGSVRAPAAEEARAVSLRTRVANDYRRVRFGEPGLTCLPGGRFLASLMPQKRRTIDRSYRDLPRTTEPLSVLDIGCGNGQYLATVKRLGHRVVGVDPDPQAVAYGSGAGLDLRHGDAFSILPSDGPFDVITMSHVIEHVHDPRRVLSHVHDLLVPGGTLWVETPNVAAQGHRDYGSSWRGLEPPRHLVLFTWRSLRRLLREVGFTDTRSLPFRYNYADLAAKSARIAAGHTPYGHVPRTAAMKRRGRMIALSTLVQPSRTELVTMIARRG